MPAILATAYHWLVGSPLLSAKMPGEQGVRIISVTISSKVMRGVQPSFSFALVGSPSRVCTSVGRKQRGSATTMRTRVLADRTAN
jgi:hypothetical protein